MPLLDLVLDRYLKVGRKLLALRPRSRRWKSRAYS